MTSGQDLLLQNQEIQRKLDAAVSRLAINGQVLARAERDYRIALRQEILKLREAGYPVTVIPDLARGDSYIADLKFKRDTADGVYNANMEAINVWKLQARLMEAQMQREWTRRE